MERLIAAVQKACQHIVLKMNSGCLSARKSGGLVYLRKMENTTDENDQQLRNRRCSQQQCGF